MKKILVILICFAVCACSKDEEEEKEKDIPLSEYLIAKKKETNQDSIFQLLNGAWDNVDQTSRRSVYISKNNFGYTNSKGQFIIDSEKYFFVKTGGGAIQIVDESNPGDVSALLVKVEKDTMFLGGLRRFGLDENSRSFKESYTGFDPSPTTLKKVKFD